MKKRLFLQALMLLSLTLSPVVMNVATAKGRILWIDVRTPQEFAQGHLSNAISIPYHQIAKKIATVAPNKRQEIHLYCHSGRRAQIALETLKKLGYINVQNRGGLAQLMAMGMR